MMKLSRYVRQFHNPWGRNTYYDGRVASVIAEQYQVGNEEHKVNKVPHRTDVTRIQERLYTLYVSAGKHSVERLKR
jgi:hypothetical protein